MKKIILLSSLLALSSAFAQNVTITIGGYDGPTDTATVNDLINKYVKPAVDQDGITVKYVPTADFGKTIKNQLSAGTAPDLFYLESDAVPELSASGKLTDLTKLVKSTDFLGNLNKVFTLNGKLYGVPKDFNTLVLYYNKDLFDQAKVSYPSNNDTWNTFETKITAVQKALGGDYKGTCFPAGYDRFGAFAASTGWKPFNAQGKTVLDANFTRAFEWYASLVKKGVAVQPSQVNAGWGGDCIKSGKVATAFEGAWALGFLRDQAPNLKYGTALLPRDPQTKGRGNLLYTVAWAVNADSKNKAAALKVLSALTSVQTQQYVLSSGLALPSRKALQTDPYFKKTTVEAMANKNVFTGASGNNVFPFAPGKYGADWFGAFNEALKSTLDGTSSSADAIKRAQDNLNRIMK